VIIDVPVFKGFAITEFDPLAFFLSKRKGRNYQEGHQNKNTLFHLSFFL
jgi:hypothetical protein